MLGDRHPEVIALRAQLADSRRQIGAEVARLLASAKNDYQEARQRETALGDALAKAQVESGAGDQNLVKLQQAEREAKTDRDVYDELASRQRALIEGTGMTPTDLRIVSPARPAPRLVARPGRFSWPRRAFSAFLRAWPPRRLARRCGARWSRRRRPSGWSESKSPELSRVCRRPTGAARCRIARPRAGSLNSVPPRR